MSEDPSLPAASPYFVQPAGTVTVTEYSDDDFAGTSDPSSTKDVAMEQIAGVGHTATGAGQHVTSVAKDQASNVAAEASTQAKNLLGQTRTELQQQAATQQQRIAAGIRSLGDELGSMAAGSQQPGLASDLAGQASAHAGTLAGWLEGRDPGALLSEVTSFARRRPGTFLALAAGAGLLAGRLTRGAVDAAHDATSAVPPATAATAATDYEPLEPWDGQVRP